MGSGKNRSPAKAGQAREQPQVPKSHVQKVAADAQRANEAAVAAKGAKGAKAGAGAAGRVTRSSTAAGAAAAAAPAASEEERSHERAASSGPELEAMTPRGPAAPPRLRDNALFEDDGEGSSATLEQQLAQLLEELQQPDLSSQAMAAKFQKALGGMLGKMQQQQQQLQQLEQQAQRQRQLLTAMGVTSDETARQAGGHLNTVAEGGMVDAAQLTAQNTALTQTVQQLNDQLQTVTAKLGAMERQAAKEQQRHTVAVHVPASADLEEVGKAVGRAAGVQVRGAGFVHRAAAAAEQAPAAAVGSSAGAGSSSGARRGGRFSVIVLELRSQSDVRAVLSGRTRMALKNAGLPFFVDDDLSFAERQQRRQLQPLRRQLRAQGKRTRWSKAQLQQRVQDAQGRWSWQVAAYPAAPAGSEMEEGELPGSGQGEAGGDAAAAGAAAS